ncbi:alcohol acetyltransferase-domain-containing protein [Xylaria intraflava]|nr:alcohol acetyltransferase-domain-containing protein [Xylaria intraflava]
MPSLRDLTISNGASMRANAIRKLGHVEAYQLAMYVLDQYRGTSVSCRYVIPPSLRDPSQRQQLTDVVLHAISECVSRHPVLQVGIANAETNQATFVHLDSLDLRQYIEWKYLDASADFESNLCQLTTSQLDATFHRMDRHPGWRIVVLHQQGADFLEMLFTWNHPHADGTSGKIFHQDLIQILNTAGPEDHQAKPDPYILRFPDKPKRFPPTMEQIMKLPLDVEYLGKTLWQDSKPPTWRPSQTLAYWAPVVSSPYKTQFRSFTIENDVLSRILSACRCHKTTLTGLLHGLAFVILASRLGKEAASGFQATTTINMRQFVPSPPGYEWLQPDRTMANFVTQMQHKFKPGLVAKFHSQNPPTLKDGEPVLGHESTSLIWDTAARVRGEIADKLSIGGRNDIVGAMKFVRDWNTQMKNTVRKPRQASWMVTGLGVLDGINASSAQDLAHAGEKQDQLSSWRIRRAQFALSVEVAAAAFIITPMTALGERLCVGCTWQDCVIDEVLGENIVADLERLLGHMAEF